MKAAMFASTDLTPTPGEGISGFTHAADREIQVSRPVGAEDAEQFDRGNRVYRVAFKVSRYFTSLLDADTFVTGHPDAIFDIGKADLKLTKEDDSFATLSNALGSAAITRHDGLSVEIQYVFSGGPWA